MTIRSNFTRSVLKALPLLALPLLAVPAGAQTMASDGTTTARSGHHHNKMDDSIVVVAAAVDDAGNADNAKRALRSANHALALTPGYEPLPTSDYSALGPDGATQGMASSDWSYPFSSVDYQRMGKVTKAGHALSVEVSHDGGQTSAVAELFDTKSGGLVGRGTGTAAGGAVDPVDSAVTQAVLALNQTATFDAIVISRPGAYQARLSVGDMQGARAGATVEYLDNGTPFAYGTIIDLGEAESVATVAPESAYPRIYANMKVRVVANPTKRRAMPSAQEISDKEDKRFESQFAFSSAAAIAVYYIFIH